MADNNTIATNDNFVLDLSQSDNIVVDATQEIQNNEVVVLEEDFNHVRKLVRLDTVAESDLASFHDKAFSNSNSDGALLFNSVDTSGLNDTQLTFTIETAGKNRNGFEQADSYYGDLFRVELILENGDIILLDQFEVTDADVGLRGDLQTFVGSISGQTFDGDVSTLEYDIPDDIGNFQLNFVTQLTAWNEILLIDDVEITGNETIQGDFETGLLANDGNSSDLQIIDVEGTALLDLQLINVTLFNEDFKHAGRDLERLDTVTESDLRGNGDVARATRHSDGILEFAAIDVSEISASLFSFNLNADVFRGAEFESTGRFRDVVEVQFRTDGGAYQTLDIFEVVNRDGQQFFVGRNTSQEVSVDGDFANLNFDLSTIGYSAETIQLRIFADVTSRNEVFEIDDVSLIGTQTEFTGDGVATINLASGAIVTVQSDGSFDYDANDAFDFLAEDETTTDTFTYTVVDGSGNTDTAEVTINIIGTNEAPIIIVADVQGTVTESEDEGVVLSTQGGIQFEDVDLNDSHTVSITPSGTGFVGTLIASITDASTGDGAGIITWVYSVSNEAISDLDEGESLIQEYEIIIDDGQGGTATQTISIEVNGINNLPGLFTGDDDTVNFNNVLSGSYLEGTQYDALEGDDNVILASTEEQALEAGFDPNLTFNGLSGNDRIIGGDLNDLIDGGDDNDELFGFDGNDTLAGGSGNDEINGGLGNDLISGGIGDDNLIGNLGDDEISGGSGNDRIVAGDGLDIVDGGDGNDLISGGGGNDIISGGDGNDEIDSDGGDDTISGDGGDDNLDGSEGNDTIDGGIGNDFVFGNNGDDTLFGGDGNDEVIGGRGDDLAEGGAGNDTVSGASGNDILRGGQGNDTVSGNDGNDIIEGNDGDDSLFGNNGDDQLFGGNGDDVINTGNGFNRVEGGAGADDIDAGGNDDVLFGQDGDDNIFANNGDDQLFGGNGDDILLGGRDNDMLSGGAGNDNLNGGSGNDNLDGNSGSDIVNGLTGDDTATYVLSENTNATDLYIGNQDIDTLVLSFTSAEWANPAIRSEVEDLRQFIMDQIDPTTGEANNVATFQFTEFDLSARGFEIVRVLVDGEEADNPVVTQDDTVMIGEDAAATNFASVLSNDQVADGIQTISLITGPTEGTLIFNDNMNEADAGSFSFDPNGAFDDLAVGESRNVTFTYQVADTDGDSDQAVVTVMVQGANDAPEANGDELSVNADTTLDFSDADLLSNDIDIDKSDNNQLVIQSVDGNGLVGTLTDNGDGTFSYDPNNAFDDLAEGEIVTETFAYTITDPSGDTSSATVTISVAGTNRPPLQDADFGPSFIFINQALDFSFGADAFVDDDGGTDITYSAELSDGSPLPDWLSFDPLTRTFSGTPDDQDVDASLIRVTATEGNGNSSFVDFPLTVLNGTIIDGTPGNDTLSGSVDGDLIRGFEGNDNITGDIGIDLIQGGDGFDTIGGGDGNDVIDGGAGNDRLLGEDGDDIIFGGEGNDDIRGGLGNDSIFGEAGDDLLRLDGGNGLQAVSGGEGDDRIILSGLGTINVSGGTGNDILTSSMQGLSIIDLGSGDDRFSQSTNSGRTVVTLGEGQDTFVARLPFSGDVRREVTITDFQTGFGGDVYNFEGILNSSLVDFSGSTNPFGDFVRIIQDGADTLFQVDIDGASGAGDYVTVTRIANTQISDFTFENFDPAYNPDGGPTPGQTIIGTADDDILTGGVGDDIISGLDGIDILDGDAGNDEINGGAGRDTIRGGFGNDVINGGEGIDSINGGDGNDELFGGADSDSLNGGAGDDFLDGGEGNDNLNGGLGNDTIFGGGGNDRITANEADIVDAGSGDDFISFTPSSASGSAVFTLGDGSDALEIRNTNGAAAIVTDFQTGPNGDVLDLDFLTTSSLNYDGFTNLFAAGYLRLVAENGGTAIEYDRDASGVDFNFSRLVFLEGVDPSTLTAENFDPDFDPNGASSPSSTIDGTNGSDIISGPSGDDILNGLGGNDQLQGGFGNDLVNGGDGNDNLFGNVGNDTILGGAGNDSLSGGRNDDVLDGGEGDDRLIDSQGSNTFIGGAGNDEIIATGGTAAIDAGEGDDVVMVGRTTAAEVTLGSGRDLFEFSASGGLTGSTSISDFAAGIDGDVVDFANILGSNFDGVSNPFGAGFARLLQDGDDVILEIDSAGVGNGGPGYREVIRFHDNNVDDFVAENFAPGLAVDGSGVSGQDIEGTNGSDNITGSFGDDTLTGLAGDDTLSGGNGVDLLFGGDGSDTLVGGFGRDTLVGGAGDDMLFGGDREDIHTGGSGSDQFIFNFVLDEGGDTITDFEDGLDTIVLLNSGFSDVSEFNLTQVGADTVISFDNGNLGLVLQGVDIATLDNSDFVF